MAGIIVSLVFFIFSLVKGSSFFEPVGIAALNPEKDPIFDPLTGKWSFDTSMDPVYEPTDTFSPLKSTGEESPYFFKDDLLISPSNTNSSDLCRSFSPKNDPCLYVPEKCIGYMRLWDVYMGYPEEKNEIIGWISHLGYVKDMVNDLSLATSNVVYSIIPSKSRNMDNLISILPECHVLEIVSEKFKAFHNLFTLSTILEKRFKRGPIVAVYLIFHEKYAHIRIVVNRAKESSKYFHIQDNLLNDFPSISQYFPYI